MDDDPQRPPVDPLQRCVVRLPWRGRGLITLANGTDDQCDIYAATIVWDGRRRSILVEAAETAPLRGMTPLHGYRLHIEVIDGGSVIIGALQ